MTGRGLKTAILRYFHMARVLLYIKVKQMNWLTEMRR